MQVDALTQTAAQKKFSMYQAYAMLVTHPYVIFSGVLVVSIIGVYSAHSMYHPFFTAYEAGCTPDRNGKNVPGTFFTDTAYVIAYGFATRDGNNIRVDGLNLEEATRMRTCDAYRATTLPIQATFVGNLTQLNQTHHKSAEWVHLMRKCYDTSVVVPSPARYPPLAESLGVSPANGACEVDFASKFELEDGIFSGEDPRECADPDECNQCMVLSKCVQRQA